MKGKFEIEDNEIRIIGPDDKGMRKPRWPYFLLVLLSVVVAGLSLRNFLNDRKKAKEVPSYYEPGVSVFALQEVRRKPLLFGHAKEEGCTCAMDTVINDVGLRLFMPRVKDAVLHVGMPPVDDSSIVYIAQAADIRADNKKILGAFVLGGKPLAWGLSKKGFCSIIDGEITVGVSDNSPLFEEATEKGGYFFRQYPLVNEGVLCENEPKNKSYRRAICQRDSETFMAHSDGIESFHDFAQALVDLGVDNAIYIVGSEAYGWAVLPDGTKEEWGIPRFKTLQKNTSYIIFRK